jgi:hypothetical protein
MGLSLVTDDTGVHVRLTGWDTVWSLRRRLDLDLRDVVSAEAVERTSAQATIGLRLGGTYLPGRIAAGNYTVRKHRGERQFWCVRRARRVLRITTNMARPRYVVLEVDDPTRVAAELTRLVGD